MIGLSDAALRRLISIAYLAHRSLFREKSISVNASKVEPLPEKYSLQAMTCGKGKELSNPHLRT